MIANYEMVIGLEVHVELKTAARCVPVCPVRCRCSMEKWWSMR